MSLGFPHAWPLGTLGMLCLWVSIACADTEYDTRTVLEQAPTGWTEYGRLIRILQCKADNQLTVEGKVTFHCVSELKQNRRSRLCIRHYLQGGPKKPTDKAEGFNEQYAFSMSKPASSQDWRLEEIVLDWKDAAKDVNDPHSIMQETDILLRVDFIDLATLFKRPEFRIEKVKRAENNSGYVVVDFSCLHDYKSQPFFPVQRGRVVLMPNSHWCVAEANLLCRYMDGEIDVTIKNDFQISSKGSLPLPVKHVATQIGRGQSGKKVSRTITYSDVREEEANDREFRLTAFGLPEPTGLKYDKPYPWYVWGLIIGVVLLLGGLLIRRYAFRRA